MPLTLFTETDDDDEDDDSSQLDKLVEVKGVGVAVSHPALELDQNTSSRRKTSNTPMPHLSATRHNGNECLSINRTPANKDRSHIEAGLFLCPHKIPF